MERYIANKIDRPGVAGPATTCILGVFMIRTVQKGIKTRIFNTSEAISIIIHLLKINN